MSAAALATRERTRPYLGACGRNQPDGKAMCESRWQRVPATASEGAVFRAWHRWQPKAEQSREA